MVILTPIYLLVGCALPHWCAFHAATTTTSFATDGGDGGGSFPPPPPLLPPYSSPFFLSAADAARASFGGLAGIIVLGVGDAAAAVGGSAFGRTKWRPGADGRTLEGSAAAFAAMLLASLLAAVAVLGIPPVPGTTAPFLAAEEGKDTDASAAAAGGAAAAAAAAAGKAAAGGAPRLSLTSLLMAVSLSTLLEAHTSQIDNLVLPIYGAVLFPRAVVAATG